MIIFISQKHQVEHFINIQYISFSLIRATFDLKSLLHQIKKKLFKSDEKFKRCNQYKITSK